MPPIRPTDVSIEIDRWHELLRIAAVMGYCPKHCATAAALQALGDAHCEIGAYDVSNVEVTERFAIIRRREGS